MNETVRSVGSHYQLPEIALVCSFPGPDECSSSSSSSSFTSSCSSPVPVPVPVPVLLCHSSLVTLFHEFGHCMHHVLSRTQFQHLAGTRCEQDFVEIPSLLFEFYAYEPQLLQQFAKHYTTGHTIPNHIIHTLKRQKKTFQAYDTMQTALQALYDQLLHTHHPNIQTQTQSHTQTQTRTSSSSSSSSSSSLSLSLSSSVAWSSSLWLSLLSRFGVVCDDDDVSGAAPDPATAPAPAYFEGTHWETLFSHICSYGGTYYSYLYARVFATAIWKHMFKQQPINTQQLKLQGQRLRTVLLVYGGARDPQVMLRELLGRDWSAAVDNYSTEMQEEEDEKNEKQMEKEKQQHY